MLNKMGKQRLTGLYALRRLTAARATKNRSRASPFVRFFSATFGAGVVASQRPITCPKRRIQPKRYAPVYHLKSESYLQIIVTKINAL